MISLILNSMLMTAALAADLTCLSGPIRVHDGWGSYSRQAHYCFNLKKDQLWSENCLNESCDSLSKTRARLPLVQLMSPVGKPGSKLCKKLGGNFQIVEFQADQKWWKLDRCVSQKDQSFVDTDTLLSRYMIR